METMSHHRIGFLALQETFERVNDPPLGLFDSTYSKAGDNGRRGIMMVVHPALEMATQLAPGLGLLNPNVIWLQADLGGVIHYVASVYFPDNRKDKEADLTAKRILEDIEAIPKEAPIIIMGDWNYDPFEDKGQNKTAFRLVHSHPRLYLVRRSDRQNWTRPASRSHIDNIFISKTFATKVTTQMTHYHIPAHARAPSDHTMIGITSVQTGRRGRMRSISAQYDDAPLRECENHPFTRVLDELAGRWMRWFRDLQDEPAPAFDTHRQEVEVLFTGLKPLSIRQRSRPSPRRGYVRRRSMQALCQPSSLVVFPENNCGTSSPDG